jgi:hypothetical protein
MGSSRAASHVGRRPQVNTKTGYAVDDPSVAVMRFLKWRVDWYLYTTTISLLLLRICSATRHLQATYAPLHLKGNKLL